MSPPQLVSSSRTELMPSARRQSHLAPDTPSWCHSSSAAHGRHVSPAWGLKPHPEALQVEKVRHGQVQRLPCITQLTGSKVREIHEPLHWVYHQQHFLLLTAWRSCLGCVYLACSLSGTRAGAGRRDSSHSLPENEPNANSTWRHCQSIPSSSSNADGLA